MVISLDSWTGCYHMQNGSATHLATFHFFFPFLLAHDTCNSASSPVRLISYSSCEQEIDYNTSGSRCGNREAGLLSSIGQGLPAWWSPPWLVGAASGNHQQLQQQSFKQFQQFLIVTNNSSPRCKDSGDGGAEQQQEGGATPFLLSTPTAGKRNKLHVESRASLLFNSSKAGLGMETTARKVALDPKWQRPQQQGGDVAARRQRAAKHLPSAGQRLGGHLHNINKSSRVKAASSKVALLHDELGSKAPPLSFS